MYRPNVIKAILIFSFFIIGNTLLLFINAPIDFKKPTKEILTTYTSTTTYDIKYGLWLPFHLFAMLLFLDILGFMDKKYDIPIKQDIKNKIKEGVLLFHQYRNKGNKH